MVEHHTQVIVIGLGTLGSAAAWQLARRGVRVVGLERFELGQRTAARGAARGAGQIVRQSYRAPGHVAGAIEAYRDWAELEADSRRRLLRWCGGVAVIPAGAPVPAEEYTRGMVLHGVPFQLLDPASARRRWPALAFPDGCTVLYQERTAIAAAALGTRIMQQRAIAHGAVLRPRHEVVELADTSDGVEVTCADGRTLSADAAVVTADAWTNRVLAGLDVQLPLTVAREQLVQFEVTGREPEFAPGRFPVWTWADDRGYFGLPCSGEPRITIGRGPDAGPAGEDGYRPSLTAPPDGLARVREFVTGFIPGAGAVSRVTTSLDTVTPDREPVLGTVPGHDRVVVGLGSAYGFTFAPWFGRVLADLATGGGTGSQISAFGLDRPALAAVEPHPQWLP